jgi:hypothetical protein
MQEVIETAAAMQRETASAGHWEFDFMVPASPRRVAATMGCSPRKHLRPKFGGQLSQSETTKLERGDHPIATRRHPQYLRRLSGSRHCFSFIPNTSMNILIILLIILLLGGGGYGFRSGNHLMGGGATIVVIILVVLLLTGRI